MLEVCWRIELLIGERAVLEYALTRNTTPEFGGWRSVRAEEPAWSALRAGTEAVAVAQDVVPEELLRAGGSPRLDADRRGLFLSPAGKVFYIWDGMPWRGLQPVGSVYSALNAYRQMVVARMRKLFGGRYPAAVARVHLELFDDCEGEVGVRLFFYDRDWTEVFVYVDGVATYPGPLCDDELSMKLSTSEVLPSNYLEEDVLEVEFDAADVIRWFADCAQAGGVGGFPLAVSCGFHDRTPWTLTASGAKQD